VARLVPVLPLKDLVLLPGMMTRVHIIQVAGMAAIDEHLERRTPFLAVPTLGPIGVEDPRAEDLAEVGVLARVIKAVRLGDGTARVLLEGEQRVRVSGIRTNDDFVGMMAAFRPIQDFVETSDQVDLLVSRLREDLKRLVQQDARLHTSFVRLIDIPVSPSRLADMVAGNLTLSKADLLEILSEANVDRRLRIVLRAIGRELDLKKLGAEIQKDVQDTMDKQQREYYLREHIRALQKELGEGGRRFDDAEDFEARLRAAGMPESSLEEALRELERMRRMHPDAAEYTVSRTWLEWLVGMPWTARSEDNADLARAALVLDEDHYGLEKVKERILEYLAVRRLNPTGKGPILCFLGPPGVGKTSLGRSVARALGRNFQRVSLGGVKDEAEIRGHRRTYVGALPGRIVHAMKRAATKNPVVILDEVDKVSGDFRGDPASALLEVLDPEQNHAFVDHYLDVPFDLSEVLFLATANVDDPIPAALHDRMEIIEIPGYIHEEKVEIARRHLLPRLRTNHGISENGIRIGQRALDHVIESYTREAGVRSLERELAKLHRKVARQIVEGRTQSVRIDDERRVQAFLGPPRHFTELAERADTAGVAIGLAWTEFGGDILFIEATSFAGTAGLKLTGHLGQVMKESAEAAMSFVRRHAHTLGISEDIFEKTLIHLHVPAGAIPKDGPSAGVTMVTALVSLLTGQRVRAQVAMTGEITLRGKVLPVGGIKEKILAARRAGVKEIILPRHNDNDLVDIPDVLRRDLLVHLVDTIPEVLALGLEQPVVVSPQPREPAKRPPARLEPPVEAAKDGPTKRPR
jgi:ATP-dependent Lon protease